MEALVSKAAKIVPPNPATRRGRRTSIAFCAPKNVILYGSYNSVVLRDAADPTNCQVVRLHRANVTAVTAEKEGNYFASGDVDGTVKVWSRNAEGEFIQQWSKDLQGEVTDLRFFNNGQRIAVCTAGRTVRAFIWGDNDVMGDTPTVH